MIPDGAQSDVTAVAGAVLAGPARRGEVLTDVRLLGPTPSTQAAAGPGTRLVAVRLADAGLIDLIRPGDVVDILAGPGTATQTGAPRVVGDRCRGGGGLSRTAGCGRRPGGAPVALPAAAAHCRGRCCTDPGGDRHPH